jgi:hypothetical protein
MLPLADLQSPGAYAAVSDAAESPSHGGRLGWQYSVMSATSTPRVHRLLIATGGTAVSPADLPSGVQLLLDAADQILVVAPSLPARIDWITSDTDRARRHADQRLHTVLGQLEELGVTATGALGSDEPLEALEDAIRSFAPDHLLIAVRSETQAGWQERGLLEKIQQRFGIPMTVFQIPSNR